MYIDTLNACSCIGVCYILLSLLILALVLTALRALPKTDRQSAVLHIPFLHSAVPDIASPEGQKGDDNEIGTGFIVGIVVGGVIIVAIVLVVGVVCTVKVRTRSKSKSFPVHDHSNGYGNFIACD